MGGALGYNHILVMLLGEDVADEFHYTYTIYNTQPVHIISTQSVTSG